MSDSVIVVGPFEHGYLATCPACAGEPAERRFVGFGAGASGSDEAVGRVIEHLERTHEWSLALIDSARVEHAQSAAPEALARAEGLELGANVEL